MERRDFLIGMGLSWFASVSPVVIAAIFEPERAGLLLAKSEGLQFYVSPNGNDNWSGKLEMPDGGKTDGPFATLHRAREALRQLKRQQGGALEQPVTVLLREGIYFLSEPLVFESEDSGTKNFPITYKAYPNEKPIISGGRVIGGWKQQGNLWVASLPELKQGKQNFRILRVGNEWAIRARYPKFDPKQPRTGGWLYVDRVAREGKFDSYIGHNEHLGDRLEWNISVPAAGEYKVWIRYANNMKSLGVEEIDGTLAIGIGKNANVPLTNLKETGSWSSFAWALSATIYLSAGEQQLIWQNLKGIGGINIDAFCLTDDPNWNPNSAIDIDDDNDTRIEPPRKGKSLIVVHGEAFKQAIGRDITVIPWQEVRDRLPIAPARFPNWKNWQGAEINIFMERDYGNSIFPISSVDSKKHTIFGNFVNADFTVSIGNRFFIENVREALDSPGEWYSDAQTGELFYYPQTSDFPNNTSAIASVLDKSIVLRGGNRSEDFVEHIHFEGLTFRDTDYQIARNYFVPQNAAIWLSKARQCQVENCNFIGLGGYGIALEQSSNNNQIVKNTMTDLGQGGVMLISEKAANQPFNNLIAANDIHDCGKIYKHVSGVQIVTGSGNLIAHNRIYNMPRYGIGCGSPAPDNYSRNNIIEYNLIYDTCLETSDCAAITTLGWDKQVSNNIIRFNFIRNVVGMKTKSNGEIISPDLCWGIYLDEYSSGYKVYGNVVSETPRGAIMIHGGKDNLVENNIFINGADNQILLWPKDDFMKGNVFRRNIIVYNLPRARLLASNPPSWRRDSLLECNFNLYWNSSGLDISKIDLGITPEGTFAQWQAKGFDINSVIGNPLFIATEKEDFRLNSNSPALKLGFKQIPIEKIGIQGFGK